MMNQQQQPYPGMEQLQQSMAENNKPIEVDEFVIMRQQRPDISKGGDQQGAEMLTQALMQWMGG